MGLIDNLVNVKISISEGVGSSASFSNILLVGIAADDATPKNIAVYASANEILEAGWDENSAIYKAAVVAFMNGATQLYVAEKGASESIADVLSSRLQALNLRTTRRLRIGRSRIANCSAIRLIARKA